MSRAGVPPASVQQLFAAHQTQRPITFAEKTFLPQLAYETEGALTETSAAAASSEALRYSLRGARRRTSESRGASRTLSIHWLRSENRYADSGGGSFCRRARGGGAALSFSRPDPTKCRKPSRSRTPTATSGANWERKLTRLFATLGEMAAATTASVANSLVSFLSQFAPDVAVGVLDREGFRHFVGSGLEKLNAAPPPRARRQKLPPPESAYLFSDLSQWMLKVLLAPLLSRGSSSRAAERISQRFGACSRSRGLRDERLPFRTPVAAGRFSRRT